MTSRRGFLRQTTILAVGAMGGMSMTQAYGVEPVKRKGAPSIKVGCAAYSYRAYLKGESPEMSIETFLETAADIGCDGVELTSYYFPPDVSSSYINRIKRKAFLLGLDVSATSVGNKFTLPPGDERVAQISSVKRWIELGAMMGAPCIRIFAGGAPEGVSEEQAIKWVVECIGECIPLAEKHGVVIALENHHGVTSTPEQVLSIINAVGSEWVGLNLDTGNFRTKDPYADLEKVAPFAVTTHFKTEMFPEGAKEKVPADLGRIVRILRDAGYRGYLTLEYEASEDPKVAVPKTIAAMKQAVGS